VVPEVFAEGCSRDQQLNTPTVSAGSLQGPGARLLSLDIFRGATIAGMLLVNNPGTWSTIYDPLEHAAWNGWTPTDLIFPFFIFISGVSMAFSFAARSRRGDTRGALLRSVLRRSATLFLLGLLLHAFPHYFELSHLRIPGVLQRIALAYLFSGMAYVYLGRNARVILVALLLLGYWALQTLVPVPGGFTGVLEPGMDLGGYIDRIVFGTNHLWRESKTWDPEGLLSTLPAIATALLGAFTGDWMRSERDAPTRTAVLFFGGNILLALGLMWSPLFPINKSLWTSSYVLFTAGFACNVLAMCYWLVDVKGYRRWAVPFVVLGMNAITAFFLSSLFSRIIGLIKVDGDVALKTWIYRNAFASWLAPINASLAFAVVYVVLWTALMSILYKRRIFIRV
jgi:predicted acyltransferase